MGGTMHSPLSEVSEFGRVGRYSDFWLRTYASPSPLFRVVIRGFVASYSSATVADFHGVPCANARYSKSKELPWTIMANYRPVCDAYTLHL